MVGWKEGCFVGMEFYEAAKTAQQTGMDGWMDGWMASRTVCSKRAVLLSGRVGRRRWMDGWVSGWKD